MVQKTPYRTIFIRLRPVLFEMPRQGRDSFQRINPSVVEINGSEFLLSKDDEELHNNFWELESLVGTPPLNIFLQSVILIAGMIDTNYKNQTILMIGLSGGGSATHVATAIDTRIDISIAVAGSTSGSGGDREQSHPLIVEIGWQEIYALSATPARKSYHFLNWDDTCCFAQRDPSGWVSEVGELVHRYGGGDYVVSNLYGLNGHK